MGSYHPAFFLCWLAGRKKQLCNADLSPILAWAVELKKKTQPKRPSIFSLFSMWWCTFLYYVDSVRSLGARKDLYVIWSYLNWRYLSMYSEDLGWIISCWLFLTFKWVIEVLLFSPFTPVSNGFVYRQCKFRCSKQWRGSMWHTNGCVRWAKHQNCLFDL